MNVLQLIKQKEVKKNSRREAQLAHSKRGTCYILKK